MNNKNENREEFMWKRRIVLLLTALLVLPSSGFAQSDFYHGKTVGVVMGARLTGTLAIAAFGVSRYLGKHIPGNPTVVFRQMPGGAHLTATNYVYNVAEADGLTILAANPAVAISQLLKMDAVRFDVRKFIWLGSSGADGVVFGIRPDLPYKTFADLRNAKPEVIVGTTGPGSNSYDIPVLLKQFAGAKLKIVSGYHANDDIHLALDRKEVDGWAALGTTLKQAAEQGGVRLIARAGGSVPGLESLPVVEDLAENALGKSLMVIRDTPLSVGRPFGVRPGTPADRAAILEKAISETLVDPAFLAEMKAAQIDIAPISAQSVTSGFKTMFDQPQDALEAMHQYLKPEQ
jgi:tripartite-type tricarboxylate transporter receptor subunit TctC